MDEQAVVLVGNLSEGFKAFGPFENFEEAADAADGLECWIISMRPAETIEDEY